MGSQLDLDQGGTYRNYQRVFLGPSVGWVIYPETAVLPITTAGSFNVLPGTNLVTINVDGDVTINLPSAKASPQGPQAIPGTWTLKPVTIVDLGGFAASVNYLIVPFGTEKISSLSSVPLASAFGGITLFPNLTQGGWTMGQSP